METQTVDGRVPRTILSAMITDPVVLAEIASYWTDGLFQHKYQQTVGGWCVDYFNQYGTAPGHHIQAMFDEWAAGANVKEDEVKFVGGLLAYASDTYKPVQPAFAIETASRYFNKTFPATRLREAAELLAVDRVDDAWAVIEDLKPIASGTTSHTTLGDVGLFEAAYDYTLEPDLFTWPEELEALNELFRNQLSRGSFVSFMAPEKVGKTFWLMELAWQAARCGNRVAFFSVGDMSGVQLRKRLIPRVVRRPVQAKEVRVPNYISPGGVADEDSVTFTTRVWEEELPRAEFEATLAQWAGSPIGQNIKLFDSPMLCMTAEGIRTRCVRLAHGGWPVDVVVVDYADILGAINGKDDSRAQTNRTWMELRRISQELNCLVLTATQADAASYTAQTITRSNFSEDKRKLAHVTGMCGINQTAIEKQLDVTRLDWVLGRELEITKPCNVAGCRSLGRVAVLAGF